MSEPLLEARGLVRTFGPVRAVDGVSFALTEGEILALFGPNGAGKSTLLRLLAGTLRPSEGEIRLRGEARDASETQWRGDLGVLSHRTALYGALTARENLAFWGRLQDVADLADRIELQLARVGLTPHAERKVGGFSRGMRQRLALARTLLHEPTLVLLDEPFTGLDLHAASLLREVLEELRDGRRTVVLVTHQLLEGLALADRVAIQARGRMVFEGARSDLPEGREEEFYRDQVALAEGSGR
ncbi:MAG: heme ABC exporter ATP-binding protein CcmA [Gemmatimonadales bacterium]|nr:MAG: heme ABC exporter ATP-binding protein CcmA [Gemmatimonadales bacterium]